MPIPGLDSWFAGLILMGGMIFLILFFLTAFAIRSFLGAFIIWGGIFGAFLIFCVVGAILSSIDKKREQDKKEQQLQNFLAKSEPYFAEKCKSAGVFIYEKDIPSQDSVYIMKPFEKEFLDYKNLQYIEHDFFNHPINRSTYVSKGMERPGQLLKVHRCKLSIEQCNVAFDYIETYKVDPTNLVRIENSLDSNGYDEELETPIDSIVSHYGITWEDISTKEDRDHWVAGGKRQIIDLNNNKIVAEVIGYVMFTNPYVGYTAWERVNQCPIDYQSIDFIPSILRTKEFEAYQLTKEKN